MKALDVAVGCSVIGFCVQAIVSAIIAVTDNNLTDRRAANFITYKQAMRGFSVCTVPFIAKHL